MGLRKVLFGRYRAITIREITATKKTLRLLFYLKKLREKSTASHRLIIINAEAVNVGYVPNLADGEYILLVDIFGNGTRVLHGKVLR